MTNANNTKSDTENRDLMFTDLLKLSDEDYKRLKLVFHYDWNWDPKTHPDYMVDLLGEGGMRLELLKMYREGKVDLVKKIMANHNPDPKAKAKRFLNGDLAFTFIKYADKDWLLVNAFEVLDDSKHLVEIDEAPLADYAPYFGRLVITWEGGNKHNNKMRSRDMIEKLKVKKILERPYDEMMEDFPGYENVNLSWRELERVLKLKTWKTALENQKGVYLITDTATNKRYVGAAYGMKDDGSEGKMLLGRWQDYVKNGHGGNNGLIELVKEKGFDYIKENFRYSILDIYKASTDNEAVLQRESWWKDVLLTREPEFGYNRDKKDVA